ncbi:unnamed protein product [Citrullus colocynthis]|uniref:Protein kinase domain-containing protein n=1 Tax=Citrullus colocynthis TaxID=252529 RepID=A0ABP0YHT3_9ROSI
MSNWNRVKVLGRGSDGTVFLAIPTSGALDFVALKVVSIEDAHSLITEETILLNFKGCPEIVQCLGSGSLAALIRRREKLTETEVKEYLKMILRGLYRIHERGYVHVVIKPYNILVFLDDNDKLKLKITDFKLSKKCDEFEEVVIATNAKPRFRGTPRYMSPESILFGKINTSPYIWSMGCILIKMISGKHVWSDCKSVGQLVKLVVNQMDLPNIPEELSREGRYLLSKCLGQKSEQRWMANMRLKHPYLQQELKLDEEFSIWSDFNLLQDIYGS